MARIYLASKDRNEWIVIDGKHHLRTHSETLKNLGKNTLSVLLSVDGVDVLESVVQTEKYLPPETNDIGFQLKAELADAIDIAEGYLATNGGKSVVIVPDSNTACFTIRQVSEELRKSDAQ